MTKQQTIEAVKRNLVSLEQLYLSVSAQGIREAIEALDKLLALL